MRKICFILIAITFGISFSLAFGQGNQVTLESEKFDYFEGDKIKIAGSVQEILFGKDLNLMIIGPNGDVILINKLTVDENKRFHYELPASSELLKDFGIYSVLARYGTENFVKDTFSFEPKNKSIAFKESKKNILLNFDFINAAKKTIQEHVDYTITITQNGVAVFGPVSKHTASGSVSLPLMISERQTHNVLIEVEGVMFQPIPTESARFNIMTGGQTILTEFTSQNSLKINLAINKNPSPDPKIVPEWVKNNAKWWSEGVIDDVSFIKSIQYLIEKRIVKITDLPYPASWMDKDIPPWVKNNVQWWANDLIEEEDFIKSIKYLVEKGIIQINQI